MGSAHMFSDQYIDKEENSKILVSRMYISEFVGSKRFCTVHVFD